MWDDETQFSITTVYGFYRELEVQTKFVFVVHPQASGQANSANKVILKGIKK